MVLRNKLSSAVNLLRLISAVTIREWEVGSTLNSGPRLKACRRQPY